MYYGSMRGIFIFISMFGFSLVMLWAWNAPQFASHKEQIILELHSFFEKAALPYRLAKLSAQERDTELLIPLRDLPLRSIANSWGADRPGGRSHEGIDMFATRGTPVFSATRGYVVRAGTNPLGGNIVFVLGPGGVRYYYAHLETIAQGIEIGKEVTTDTVLGYVGTTGNATTTPPHLHFGMYKHGAENPYPLLVER